jgi:hypothetical protein
LTPSTIFCLSVRYLSDTIIYLSFIQLFTGPLADKMGAEI